MTDLEEVKKKVEDIAERLGIEIPDFVIEYVYQRGKIEGMSEARKQFDKILEDK